MRLTRPAYVGRQARPVLRVRPATAVLLISFRFHFVPFRFLFLFLRPFPPAHSVFCLVSSFPRFAWLCLDCLSR